jgi:hypothetical protein
MFWIIIAALLALVFFGGAATFAQDIFKGLRQSAEDLECEGLTGELAGLSGMCFQSKTPECANPSDPESYGQKDGEWVYVGDKGCRAKSETHPYCCVLMPGAGVGDQESRLERSCALTPKGGVALVTSAECIQATAGTAVMLADPYTAVRYYLKEGDQQSGDYTLRMEIQGSGNPLALARTAGASAGTPFVEFKLPTGPVDLKLQPSFIGVLANLPETKDRLSELNNGGTAKIRVLSPGGQETALVEGLTIPKPATPLCSAASASPCAGKFPGRLQAQETEKGFAYVTTCTMQSDGSCVPSRGLAKPATCDEVQNKLDIVSICNEGYVFRTESCRVSTGGGKGVICTLDLMQNNEVWCTEVEVPVSDQRYASLADCVKQ